jgi:DNA-binding transcriptional LysR family regulator
MDLIAALQTFARVAEVGSLSAVARESHNSPSAVTRQIAQLEARFDIRLFHRSTRRMTITDDGQELLAHARRLLEIAESMEGSLGRHQGSPSGHVRVGTSVGAGLWLTRRLPTLFARYPGLEVELVMRDHLGDMIEERLDLATIEGDVTDNALISRRIGEISRVAVAAPAYLARRGAPLHPSDLVQHDCIIHHRDQSKPEWTFKGPEGLISVTVSGPFSANNSEAVHQAALAGAGIAMLPHQHVIEGLRTGRLYSVLGEYPSEPRFVHVVYPTRRHLAPRTRVVIDFLVTELQTALAQLAKWSAMHGDDNPWLV